MSYALLSCSRLLSSPYFSFFFHCYVVLRDLHSFPTRRSSDLCAPSRLLGTPRDVALVETRWRFARAARHNIKMASPRLRDRKSTRLNSSHLGISYAVFCLKKKKNKKQNIRTTE